MKVRVYLITKPGAPLEEMAATVRPVSPERRVLLEADEWEIYAGDFHLPGKYDGDPEVLKVKMVRK